MVLPDRIELSTSPLPRECSTTELRQQSAGPKQKRREKGPLSGRFLPQGPVMRKQLVVRCQHSHPIAGALLRMLASKDHQQIIDASGALDLTFACKDSRQVGSERQIRSTRVAPIGPSARFREQFPLTMIAHAVGTTQYSPESVYESFRTDQG
jgi:hypothetical protein